MIQNILKKRLVLKFVYDLTTFVLKNLRRLFDKYSVASTEHDALVKSMTKIYSFFLAFSENPNFISDLVCNYVNGIMQ